MFQTLQANRRRLPEAYGGDVYRLILAALVAASPLLLAAPANACSAGPSFDVRAATQVLVIGQVTGVELVVSATQPPKGSEVWYRKVVTVRVQVVLKGRAPADLRFSDAGIARYSTLPNGQRMIDWGGGGDCSTIESDPTGRYMAVALGGPDGDLTASILLGAVVTDNSADPRITTLVARHGLSLPSTSTR